MSAPASVREVFAAASQPRQPEIRRARSTVQIPLKVRPTDGGGADLVDAKSGRVVSPCASVEVAQRTCDFFQ